MDFDTAHDGTDVDARGLLYHLGLSQVYHNPAHERSEVAAQEVLRPAAFRDSSEDRGRVDAVLVVRRATALPATPSSETDCGYEDQDTDCDNENREEARPDIEGQYEVEKSIKAPKTMMMTPTSARPFMLPSLYQFVLIPPYSR